MFDWIDETMDKLMHGETRAILSAVAMFMGVGFLIVALGVFGLVSLVCFACGAYLWFGGEDYNQAKSEEVPAPWDRKYGKDDFK
jgi:hypothetical protein